MKITKEEFYSNPTRYLKMIEDYEIEKIIIQNDKKRSFIIASKENYFHKQKARCCSNESDRETIGFFLLAIVIIISLNFGNR